MKWINFTKKVSTHEKSIKNYYQLICTNTKITQITNKHGYNQKLEWKFSFKFVASL